MAGMLLPTSTVGSYPQPEWLIDRVSLHKMMVPRTRAPQLWRVAPELLQEAQDDATLLAIRDQERAGLDIITDGEIHRESYSNFFVNSLVGVDREKTGYIQAKLEGKTVDLPVPLYSGPVSREKPVGVRDVTFLRANTDRAIKITLPGPFTMSEQGVTSYYPDRIALANDLADAVNAEIKDLFAAGADVVQIDEPWMERYAERAAQYGVQVLNRALKGVTGTTAVHLCFGYGALVTTKPNAYAFLEQLEESAIQQISIEAAQSKLDLSVLTRLPSKTIILGVLDLSNHNIETPETIAKRIEGALPYVSAERLVIAPDCGMKFLPRSVAFQKLQSMVKGAQLVRRKLQGYH